MGNTPPPQPTNQTHTPQKERKKSRFVNDLSFISEIEKNIVNERFMIDFLNMVSVYANLFLKTILARV